MKAEFKIIHSEGVFPGLDIGVCSKCKKAESMKERKRYQDNHSDDVRAR